MKGQRLRAICILLLILCLSSTCSPTTSPKVSEPIKEKSAHVRGSLPSPEEIAQLPPDGGPEFNRLIFEKSPYLLQHARNPIDWYAWGEEAFVKARQEEKPIFLSIGYTTCHWCHVMERESFEDNEVADFLSQHYVCIKLDREERPDIDHLYMQFTMTMNRGNGGWPMTIFMTPEKKPFFSGTYFPKESQPGRPGFLEILHALAEGWNKDRQNILAVADDLLQTLSEFQKTERGELFKETILHLTYNQLKENYDAENGGFGHSRKFPTPHNLYFLLRYWKRTEKKEALDMVEQTLTSMRLGGIYDHIGFGIHRYSTDRHWLLPHFEKMLYDQALVSLAYLETHQATGKVRYANTAKEIFTYILRDMTAPEGGFYSAEDADSEGEEGKFYLWKPKQIKEILGQEEGDFFCRAYQITEEGNFFAEITGKKTGENIPHLIETVDELAENIHTDPTTLRKRLAQARKKLFLEREKRIHPQKDDKILTDWNGLMIAAFATGGRVLQEDTYTNAAKKSADFVLDKLSQENGQLLKRYRQGDSGLPAHLEDYAFFIWGLLELYEASFETRYLEEALRLNDLMFSLFWDKEQGGYFMTAHDGEELLLRNKTIYDGARPSGNSVAALNLIRLSRITGNKDYERKALDIMQTFSKEVSEHPLGYTHLMLAYDFYTGPSYEIVLCGDRESQDTQAMTRVLYRHFLPNKIVLFKEEKDPSSAITKIAPYTKNQRSLHGKTTAYVCTDFSCQEPTTNLAEFIDTLK